MRKILGIFLGIFLFLSSYGEIKLEDTAEINIGMKLVGNLEVKGENIDFGRIIKGRGAYVKYGTLKISEAGGVLTSPVEIEFRSEDGKRKIEKIDISNGRDKIPVYLTLENHSQNSHKIKAEIKNVDKNISSGNYEGIFKVRVVHRGS